MKSVDIILYTKQDCHLCENMLAELRAFISGSGQEVSINLTVRDIEDRAQWFERYREYVPVMVINNQEVCHYFLDYDELTVAIHRQSGTI